MQTQNGKPVPPNHDWPMYIFVGLALGIFVAGLVKWWFCL